MIVVDTNVWSEATKVDPSAAVQAWAKKHSNDLWVSCVVLAELRAGAAMLPKGQRRAAFDAQFDALEANFSDRILKFDQQTSSYYAQVLEQAKLAGKPIGTADAMIAATALQHGMSVATRNLTDFAGAGVQLIDPWTARK